jgi:hypothetical protein
MQIWNVEKAMEMSAADADAIPVLCCAVLCCAVPCVLRTYSWLSNSGRRPGRVNRMILILVLETMIL